MSFGYIGDTPTKVNQKVKNTGILSISEAFDLERQGHLGGSLKLIADSDFSSSSGVEFTSIKEDVYDVHLVQLNEIFTSSSSGYPDACQIRLRVSDDGGSNFKSGASDYRYAFDFVKTDGSTGERPDTANTDMLISGRGTTTHPVNGYSYLYNLGNSSKYSFQTMQNSLGSDTEIMFGGNLYPTASTINAIKIFATGFTITGNIKLYGVKQ
ncbi:hypothetical protein [uncultured Mediterranean phage uvMED]|nr:hypothetical protein [uncultured Mediterranean phage uvMED]BAR14789.1 hypothetical protein [uncultured Mediterranean phage uvMED]